MKGPTADGSQCFSYHMISLLSPSPFYFIVLTDMFTATYGNVSTPVFTPYRVHTASQHTVNTLSSQHHAVQANSEATFAPIFPPHPNDTAFPPKLTDASL